MSVVRWKRTRVVIVDDSRTMQAALEHLLSVRLNFDIVGTAGDGESALVMIDRLQPDLVTIDLALPYIDGQQLLNKLEIFPDIRKVVISVSSNLAIKARLEKLGADACISKAELASDPEGFCRSLSQAMHASRKSQTVKAATFVSDQATIGYPIPFDEAERLQALARLELTDTAVNRKLDLLTEHLAKTTSFPSCIITFIDRETQWVKSGFGIKRTFTPRSEAICNYTICGDDAFVVEDARSDRRFQNFGLVVSGPMIRSYIGYPIILSSGVRLGAICLLDTKPRRASLVELVNLRSIAKIAAALIEGGPSDMKHAA